MKPRRPVYVLGAAHSKFIGKFHPEFIWKKHPDFGKRENPTLEDPELAARLATRIRSIDTGRGPLRVISKDDTVDNEASLLLVPESNGWFSFSINVKSGKDKPFLKLESERFRFTVGEIGS